MAASAIDLYKCFDQVNRCVAYSLLAASGFPIKPLVAYATFMERVQIMGKYIHGYGPPSQRVCSIPQGCIWSMVIQALTTLPWIRLVKASYQYAIPRALAGDILLTSGADPAADDEEPVCEYHEMALTDTVAYFQAIGARVSAPKCMTCAATARVRSRLTRFTPRGPRPPCLSSLMPET